MLEDLSILQAADDKASFSTNKQLMNRYSIIFFQFSYMSLV